MNRYIINGGRKLYGEVDIQCAKNAVLPIFAASCMCNGVVTIHNSPRIADCNSMLNILRSLGCRTELSGKDISIDNSQMENCEIPPSLARELRSSIFLLGPILARFKSAKLAYPGGCEIGLRPIDMHLKGLRELNVDIREESGYIFCDASDMRGARIQLDLPSVGATENIMMAALAAKGITVIGNAAKEPEIVDLQNFLVKCGADIKGAGTSTIIVRGGNTLVGTDYTPIKDRIVAGTYLLAVCMCGGEVKLNGAVSADLQSLIPKLSKYACKTIVNSDNIYINVTNRMSAVDIIETSPYPGFPTDLQAQTVSMLSLARGTSLMVENMFETRFKYIPELVKMGAKIVVRGRTAIINGVRSLSGAEVMAHDLRGGAALVLAGLAAKGTTVVDNVYHIDRGYENLDLILRKIGADITRE